MSIKQWWVGAVLWLVLLGVAAPAADEGDKPADPGTLVVIDGSGKEQKIKTWKFTAGTKRMGWLAPAIKGEDAPKGKAPAGPEALVVRDELRFSFASGVLAYIPLDRIRSVQFDREAKTMTVRVATGEKDDATLVGTTAYKGINKLSLEADVDRGAAGVASLTFQGGVLRGGIQGVRFPAPKVEPGKPGRPAVVVTADGKVKRQDRVSDLLPLYRLASGEEKLLPTLMFRKTLRVDVATVKSLVASADEDAPDSVWDVTQKDGENTRLTLLDTMPVDGKPATLIGLVGRAPFGYRLFPLRRITGVHFDTMEAPDLPAPKGDKGKDEDGKKKPADEKK